MAYTWTQAENSPGGQVWFSVRNDTYCLDFSVGQPCGDNPSAVGASTLMGQVKDALEAAGLQVGEIYIGGSSSWMLTEE